MNAHQHGWGRSAVLFFFVTGSASALTVPLTVNGPAPTAQVGVPYSAAITVYGGPSDVHYGILGSLPPE